MQENQAGRETDWDMTHRKANLFSSVLCIALAVFLLLALAGCGSGELKAGQKIMKDYLSGRGGKLTECYVEMLRPDGTKPVASDYVKGTFRMDGEDYEFAVNTVTGAVYTSERMSELQSCCTAQILSRLGLDADETVTDCLVELYSQPWQTPNDDWPWERSYLGCVLPVDADTDMDGFAAQYLADPDARVLLFVACRADELSAGRWTPAVLAGWNKVEIQLFGIPADEPLPSPEGFPGDQLSSFTGRYMTLHDDVITYHDGT